MAIGRHVSRVSEQAVINVMHEVVVSGVSMRKIQHVLAEFDISSVSASTG